MPLTFPTLQFDSDLEAILRLQGILLQAAEGARGPDLDREYKELRLSLLEDSSYRDVVPPFVKRNHDLGSLWPSFKSFSPSWEPRRVEIRKQLEGALQTAEQVEFLGRLGDSSTKIDASAWTGAATGSDRLKAIKTLMPIAQGAIEQLIAALETPRHNNGPQLDETAVAVNYLRKLHRAIGELLAAADEGKLSVVYNAGLPSEMSRYAKRAAKALRNDPLPYAFSAALLAIMTACGMPDIGGYLTGVALSIKKN